MRPASRQPCDGRHTFGISFKTGRFAASPDKQFAMTKPPVALGLEQSETGGFNANASFLGSRFHRPCDRGQPKRERGTRRRSRCERRRRAKRHAHTGARRLRPRPTLLALSRHLRVGWSARLLLRAASLLLWRVRLRARLLRS